MGGASTATAGIFNVAGAPYVNSVQEVSITIGNGATSNTATITSVDTTKTFLVFQGWNSTQTTGASNTAQPRVTLTNATTVTATRDTASTDTVTVKCHVIECNTSLVQSIQYGTVAISAASSGTATISSVTTGVSVAFFLGATTTSTGNIDQLTYKVTLTNATTVTANANTSSTATVGFVVVQFQVAAITSIQKFTDTFNNSNTTNTKTITSVVTANTMLAYGGGVSGTNGDFSSGAYRRSLANSTTVNLDRGGTGAGNQQASVSVIEFASGVVKSLQRGSITLTSVTSATATISSVSTTKSICNFCNWQTANANANPATNEQAVTLTNATTITGSINTSDAGAKSVGYEVVEFN